jgi:tRNA A-37 threonylcarbamoyl transferase component Bud32
MAYLTIEPRYRDLLTAHGYASARAVLDWPGIILSGHPRRHVLRVRLGDESFILKKEHCVPLRDRLASAWAGFGWSSKSVREARLLEQLHTAGVPCPEVVAVGEDGSQAFLLMREQTGMMELRQFLTGWRASARQPDVSSDHVGLTPRRSLAHALGRELARIHAAGFCQPDLYAKHILVRAAGERFEFCVLDWQRSRPRRLVSWRRRVRDLAALDASLSAELAPDRLRLVCLRAYLRETRAHSMQLPRGVAVAIRRLSAARQRQRKMRELRQPPLPAGAQQLLWLREGERLCVVRDFFEELGGQLPSWLPQDPAPSRDGTCVEHRLILLGSGRTAHLVQRWSRSAAWLPEGKYPAPEFARAAMLFRLQRFGVAAPRLLAMGHHRVTAWQRFSFLLAEPPAGPTLAAVLCQSGPARLRQRMLRRLGAQLRQLHEAGFTLRSGADAWQLWVVPDPEMPRVALANVEVLERSKKLREQRTYADLRSVVGVSPQAGPVLSRADRMRVILGYLHRRRLDDAVRRLLAEVVPRERRVA